MNMKVFINFKYNAQISKTFCHKKQMLSVMMC